MFKDRAPRTQPADEIKFGKVRPRALELGYFPLLWPPADVAPHLASEFPCALAGNHQRPIGALLLQPIDDSELAERVTALLADRKVTRGPCRTGADSVRLYPVQTHGGNAFDQALDGLVQIWAVSVIPVDGLWRGSMLETPYADLPAMSPDLARTLVAELNDLRYRLAEERRPKSAPTRRAFLGG